MQEIMSKEELEEQKEMILDLLRSTERDGIDKLADYLSDSTDFFTAPASTRFITISAEGWRSIVLTFMRISNRCLKSKALKCPRTV